MNMIASPPTPEAAQEPAYEADPFCKAIFTSLAPDVRQSLSEHQVKALVAAVSHASGQSRHIVDLRFGIPLFFERFYVVALMGRDRRTRIYNKLTGRRREGTHAGIGATLGIMLLMMGSTLTVLTFAVLYALKWMADIDLFDQLHLFDIFARSAENASHIATVNGNFLLNPQG